MPRPDPPRPSPGSSSPKPPGASPGGRPRPLRRGPLLAATAFATAFALLALLALSRHGRPYGFDTGPHDWSVAHRPHGWLTAARITTHAGTGPYPYVAAAAGGLLGGWAGRPGRLVRAGVPTALLAVLAVLAEQLVRTALMAAFRRPRPPMADWAVHATGHAFPSGHSTSGAVAAGLLAWGLLAALPPAAGRAGAALCGLAALAIGVTRVYLGVHWPSDVVGGWLLAGCWLALVLPPLAAFARRAGPGDGAPA